MLTANTKTIERMKCHCFLRPIRRDLPSTFCTTLLNGVNHISKYLRVLLLYKLFDLSDLQFANKAKQISHVLLLYEFIHVCGNLVIFLYFMNTVEPRFNEPLYNEVLGITIFFSRAKITIKGMEENLDITNLDFAKYSL